MRIRLLVTMALLLIVAYPLVAVAEVQVDYRTMVHIYAPSAEGLEGCLGFDGTYGYAVTTTPLSAGQGHSAYYYLAWLLSGQRPASEISSLDEVEVNEGGLLAIWGNVTLVNVPLVDPSVHNYTLNPLYNATNNYIPPAILTLRVGEEFEWAEAGIKLMANYTNGTTTITLKELNETLIIPADKRESSLSSVSLNSTNYIRGGDYYIIFYLISANENEVKVFFPGALSTEGWSSQIFGVVGGYSSQWYLILKYRDLLGSLPAEAVGWWFNQTMLSISEMIKKAATVGNSMSLIYVPQFALLSELIDNASVRDVAKNYACSGLGIIVKTVIERYYMPRIVVFSPKGNAGYLYDISRDPRQLPYSITPEEAMALIINSAASTPFNSWRMLSSITYLEGKASELNLTVADLNKKLADINNTLTDTKSELAKCNVELNAAQDKLSTIEKDIKKAGDTYKQAYLYLSVGIAAPLVIAALLGLLAIHIAKKKTAK